MGEGLRLEDRVEGTANWEPASLSGADSAFSGEGVMRGFEQALELLGHIASDASTLLAKNAEALAFISAGNDRIERHISENRASLDRLLTAQVA